MNTEHLSEAEVEEALLGFASDDRTQHAKTCAACRGKIDDFKETMALFNEASMGWSQAKSNSLSRDLAGHRTPFRVSMTFVWSSASAAVLIIAGIVGLGMHQHEQTLTAATASGRQVSSGDANEIASDNAMLQEIDAAINTSEPSPAEVYRTTSANTSHTGSVRN